MTCKLNTIFKSLSLIGVIILLNSSCLYAQQSKWEKLGSRKVNFTLDKDVIQLGAKEGAFSKLMIKVTGGAINMHRMIVHYGNGGKEGRRNTIMATGCRVIHHIKPTPAIVFIQGTEFLQFGLNPCPRPMQ